MCKKSFRKRNSATNCARLFVHFETPFGVCNRARLFSALFGHAVADEYAIKCEARRGC